MGDIGNDELADLTIIDADDRETMVAATVEGDRVLLDAAALEAATGWALKPEGLCRGDVCVPAQGRDGLTVERSTGQLVDIARFADLVHEPLVIDLDARVAAYGTSAAACAEQLQSLDAPDFRVENLDGEPVELADFRGRKKLLVAFSSWCGCRYDLPDWQAMNDELADHNFTVIGVALDEKAEDVREWVAGIDFPVLLDRDHTMTERYDIRNVPTVIWIDENDRIVRPQDIAFGSDMFKDYHHVDSNPHHEALRRWVTTGALPMPDEDMLRDRMVVPTDDEQLARVHWRVAIHLFRADRRDAAERHFLAAGNLAPHDLTIRRSSLPLRGIDPFLSEEFIEMYEDYQAAGQPGYGFDH